MKKVDVPGSGVDLSGWGLKSLDEIQDIARRCAEEALELALKDNDTYAFWPGVYHPKNDGLFGEPVDDPLTVYVRIAAYSGKEQPTFSCSLREDLEHSINDYEEDGSWGEGLRRMSKAMRELADRIDAVMEP